LRAASGSRPPFSLSTDAPPAPGRTTLFPLIKSWSALLAIYLLWTFLVTGSNWYFSRTLRPWIFLNGLVSPLTHIASFALVAPLPWILWRRSSPFLGFLQGLGLSLVICESTSALLLLLDALFLWKGGVEFSLSRSLTTYLSLVGPAMIIVGGLTAARARSEEEREQARHEATVARTRLLQSQVHPHVLFNALNGLAELIHKDPPAAERSVMHLADLMRRIMRASDAPAFPLAEERAVVADYLALESLRLGSRLRVAWAWDASLDGLELPPLLLQPLVENAIKHGISPSVEGGDLVIHLRAEGTDVDLGVWNTGMPFRADRPGGIGIRNLVSRLDLACGSKAKFTLGPHEGGTLASIHLTGTLLKSIHDTSPDLGGRRRTARPGAA
jgi:hypothetical protein